MKREELKLGLYEKALSNDLRWRERLETARRLGFDFVEMSIDETDDRLARLDWTAGERSGLHRNIISTGVGIPSICLSCHRRFPLGSHDPDVRKTALEIMRKAILLASDIGVRVIQVAGYDVYYEKPDQDTDRWFLENFALCEDMAKQSQVMLAFEIMDTPYINSISRFMNLKRTFPSCWTAVYPDVGNLSAWGNDIEYELKLGADWTVAIHLKDTLAVFSGFEGKFKEVPFGTGCVDFIKVFQVLNSLRYKGPFLIEMWSEKSGNPEQEIIIARDFILKKMKESGYLN